VPLHWFQPHLACHPHTDTLADLEILINSTLVSLAATARTDSDRTVVAATLETLEDLFRSLKSTPFPLTEKALESLMVSIQDLLECKVPTLCLVLSSLACGDVLPSFTGSMSRGK